MVATDPVTPETRRFSIRLPRPLWIGLAVMLFVAEAGFGDPADVVAPKKIRLPVQLFKPAVSAATARAQFTSTIKLLDAVATRELFDNCLRQKIAIVDQVCEQTDSQKQKLQLAGR